MKGEHHNTHGLRKLAWKNINDKIQECLNSSDPISCLQALLQDYADGMVAFALAKQYELRNRLTEAISTFDKAEKLFPLKEWKEKARLAREELERKSRERASGVQSGETLFVVSCTKRKIWDEDIDAHEYVEAREAYQGDDFRQWLKDPLADKCRWLVLSAKYGFIEPNHPISNYNVTFSMPETGPISDETLINQVEHQCRWKDKKPLRSFRKIAVRGKPTYLRKVKTAFGRTQASIIDWSDYVTDSKKSTQRTGTLQQTGRSDARPVVSALRRFVDMLSNVVDVQFSEDSGLPRLPIDPRDRSQFARTAHYMLLVASIDQRRLVGAAENARRLMAFYQQQLKDQVYSEQDEDTLATILSRYRSSEPLGTNKDKIPRILASVNKFVATQAEGDLHRWGKQFHNPLAIVDVISTAIYYMGSTPNSARKKTWMFMRWMVRPYPDLHVWTNLSPKDLFVPVDYNVANVASSFGVLPKERLTKLDWSDVVTVTNFARLLFPEDPARVDYPFFLLGRKDPGAKAAALKSGFQGYF
jgi:uncharacterized protein (TIGR02757 family)